MSYQVGILPRAQKVLSGLSTEMFERVIAELRSLADNPRPHGCKKLKGREGWRTRVGDYRVVYEIDDGRKTVTVLDIRHRSAIYRR